MKRILQLLIVAYLIVTPGLVLGADKVFLMYELESLSWDMLSNVKAGDIIVVKDYQAPNVCDYEKAVFQYSKPSKRAISCVYSGNRRETVDMDH